VICSFFFDEIVFKEKIHEVFRVHSRILPC